MRGQGCSAFAAVVLLLLCSICCCTKCLFLRNKQQNIVPKCKRGTSVITHLNEETDIPKRSWYFGKQKIFYTIFALLEHGFFKFVM